MPLNEFDRVLKEHRKLKRRSTIIGLLILASMIAWVVGGIYLYQSVMAP